MKLIALSGKMTSGKSTVADYLVKVYRFKKLSFAEALRSEMYGARFEGVWKKPTPPHLRALMIAWGKARRVENPDYWIVNMRKYLEGVPRYEEAQYDIEARYVIDDMRFQNELAMVLEFGGVPIRVSKIEPLKPMRPTDLFMTVNGDISETDLDSVPFDHYLEAEAGDVKGLLECAGQLFNQMEL